MPDAMHFEAHADVYDQARPPYPTALWDAVRDLGVLEPGCDAVDLGAGSGQVTGPLIAAGLRVTAVEPGPQLAAQIRTTYPTAIVVQQSAEAATLSARSFDLVVAATSIHWLDLDVVLPKVHRWLRPDGVFLVWRNVFGDPAVTTPFRNRIARIVAQRNAPPRSGLGEDLQATSLALTRTGLFTCAAARTFRWSVELDEQHVHRLFTTFSDWSVDEVDRAAAAVVDLGGRVVEHYLSWLIVARPAAPALQPPGPGEGPTLSRAARRSVSTEG